MADTVPDALLAVPTGKDHGHLRIPHLKLLKDSLAVEDRHREVKEDCNDPFFGKSLAQQDILVS